MVNSNGKNEISVFCQKKSNFEQVETPIKKIQIFTTNVIAKLLGISKTEWDEKTKIVNFFVIAQLLNVVSIVVCVFLLVTGLSSLNSSSKEVVIYQAIFLALIGGTITISTLFFLVFKTFQFCLFVILNAVIVSVVAIHIHMIVRSGGIIAGGPIGTLIVLLAIALKFGNYFNIFYCFFIVSICLLISLLLDALNIYWSNSMITFFNMLEEAKNSGNFIRIAINYIFVYTPLFVNLIFFFIVVLLQRLKISSFEKTIDNLGSSILSLNFENEEMKKLEKKNPKNLSKNEILFQSIVKNLKTYSSFLPSYLVVSSDSSEEDTTLEEKKDLDSDNNSSKNSRGSSASIDSEDLRTLKIENPRSQQRNQLERKISYGLKKKEVVVMLIDSNIFETFFNAENQSTQTQTQQEQIEEFEKILVRFNSIVSPIIYNCKGIVHSIRNGNRIMVTFNAKNKIIEPSQRAASCAFLIEQKLKRLNNGIKSRIAIIKVNQMLNGIMKYNQLNVFQLVNPKTMLLEKILDFSNEDLFGEENNIFVDSLVKNDLRFNHLAKQINILPYKTIISQIIHESIFRIYQKEMPKDNVKNEWFFQVQVQVESKSEFKEYNDIWLEIRKKNYQKARSLLNDLTHNNQFLDRDVAFLKKKLNELNPQPKKDS